MPYDSSRSGPDPSLSRASAREWVAFCRRDSAEHPYQICKTRIDGDISSVTQLTEFPEDGAADWYPQWSPDGVWVIFQRQFLTPPYFDLYKIHADGSDSLQETPVFDVDSGKQSTYDAVTPSYSPDGAIVLFGYGPRVEGGVFTYTTAMVLLVATSGWPSRSYTFLASDPEGDPITCSASMLQSWMSFDTSYCELICHPNESVTGVYYAKILVTTPSGGSDAIIAAVVASPSLARQPDQEVEATGAAVGVMRGPNPTRGAFVVPTPAIRGATARLEVYDLSGRRVGVLHGPAGRSLVWEGRDATGNPVAPGIYLYRLDVGHLRQDGKIVVMR